MAWYGKKEYIIFTSAWIFLSMRMFDEQFAEREWWRRRNGRKRNVVLFRYRFGKIFWNSVEPQWILLCAPYQWTDRNDSTWSSELWFGFKLSVYRTQLDGERKRNVEKLKSNDKSISIWLSYEIRIQNRKTNHVCHIDFSTGF